MTWYAWAVIAVLVANVLASVYMIGKPRKPMTPGQVVSGMITNGLILWAILALAGVA